MQRLIVGNWKMHGLAAQLQEISALDAALEADAPPATAVMVCLPATLLAAASGLQLSAVQLGAQDCHVRAEGAHTGDISAEMLADAGAVAIIVGHSERRSMHGETDAIVHAKALAVRRAGLVPIVCVGETLADRDAGATLEVVTRQVTGSVPDTSESLIIAYEPVWAVGSGRTPSRQDIAEVHGHIRGLVGPSASILYGGSVKPANAADILRTSHVDGVLVGGASLRAAEFLEIIRA